MPSNFLGAALALLLLAAAAAPPKLQAQEAPMPAASPSGPAASVLAGVADPGLRDLARDALARNPALAAARARARAAEREAPQARSLPDPMASLTAYLLTPETRVGPQRAMVALSQRFPWFGKLGLREQAALYGAASAWAEVAARELSLVTETRRLAYELSFLDAWQDILDDDRETLERYEELARSRYATGFGLEQAVIKLQAEITRLDTRRLQLADRRSEATAALNALRDRSPVAPLPVVTLPVATEPVLAGDLEALSARAVASRPEIERADAEISRAETRVDLARKDYSPDVTLGAVYTLVGEREDAPGRVMPPPDNGDDVFGLTASINLPVWRRRLDAAVEQALEQGIAARESRRSVVAEIDRSLGELVQRLELTWKQLRLLEDVLGIQAGESLSSAEAAYTAGNLPALDLLDAERVLLDVRTATARNRADYAITLARLEGALGAPVDPAAGIELPAPDGARVEAPSDEAPAASRGTER
jgi:outer membrane protein TolC